MGCVASTPETLGDDDHRGGKSPERPKKQDKSSREAQQQQQPQQQGKPGGSAAGGAAAATAATSENGSVGKGSGELSEVDLTEVRKAGTEGASPVRAKSRAGLGASAKSRNGPLVFMSRVRRRIEMLAFEVANVIVRAINLWHSLLERDIEDLRQEVLASEGIRMLVSDDFDEVWSIAAEDKKLELRQVAKDVARLGMQCVSSQYQNLVKLFDGLGLPGGYKGRLTAAEAESELKTLESQAQVTADLYHELSSLDSMQQALRRRQREDPSESNALAKEMIVQMKAEVKSQEKMVKMLKKKGLWSKTMDEVVEKLMEVVVFLHDQILSTFGDAVEAGGLMTAPRTVSFRPGGPRRLGHMGMSLQYANVVNMIDTVVLRPSVVEDKREGLFAALPVSVKGRLKRTLMQSGEIEQESTESIRQKMEGVLDWLVTMAENTIRYGLDNRMQGYTDLTLLQTLYHVDEQRMENLTLLLLVGLQHLVSRADDDNETQLWPPVPRCPILAPMPAASSPVSPQPVAAAAAAIVDVASELEFRESAGVVEVERDAEDEKVVEERAREERKERVVAFVEPVDRKEEDEEVDVSDEGRWQAVGAAGKDTPAVAEAGRIQAGLRLPFSSSLNGNVAEAAAAASPAKLYESAEQSAAAATRVAGSDAKVARLETEPGAIAGTAAAAGPAEGARSILSLQRTISDKLRVRKSRQRMSIDLFAPGNVSSTTESTVGEEWLKVMAKSQGFALPSAAVKTKADRDAAAIAAAAAGGVPAAVLEAMKGKAKSQAFPKGKANFGDGDSAMPRNHSRAMSRAQLLAMAEADESSGGAMSRVRPMTLLSVFDVDRLEDVVTPRAGQAGQAGQQPGSVALGPPQTMMEERLLTRQLSGGF